MRRISGLLLSVCLATACGGETGLLDPPAGNGQTRILLSRAPAASSSVSAALVASTSPPVSFDQISSLELVIGRVEAHALGGGWTAIDLEPLTVDLAALGEGMVAEVAAGSLPAGTYNVLRFFVQSATVTFSSDITVGGASFVSGQTYDLDIPSVDNTGIQITTAHFTVEETSETVLVLFDPAASTASIGATGDGRVRMTPVLRESDQATEDGIEGDAAEGAAAESDEGEGSEEGEEGSSETESGSGSASVLLGSMVSISSSVLAGDVALGGVSRSIIPGGKIAPEDIVSLRLAVCEIRAVGKISAGDEEDA